MTYTDREYAIVVANALQLKGKHATKYIAEEFDIKIPIATYWRAYSKLQKSIPEELKEESESKIMKHVERLNLFRNWRIKLNRAIQQEQKPEALSRMIIRAAELEKYIAQLESMSVSYYEKSTRQVLEAK